jgi:hypothetical protein
MPGQTFTLADFPFDMIELACEKCGRHGKLRKARVIEQYGRDIGLAHLREKLAQCELMGRMYDPCGAYFVGLNEWWAEQPRN